VKLNAMQKKEKCANIAQEYVQKYRVLLGHLLAESLFLPL